MAGEGGDATLTYDVDRAQTLIGELNLEMSGMMQWRTKYEQLLKKYHEKGFTEGEDEHALLPAQNREEHAIDNVHGGYHRIHHKENKTLCLIDGDGSIFTKSLYLEGRDGGRKAVQAIRVAICKEYPETEHQQLHIYCFLNKGGLSYAHGLPHKDIDLFVGGFNVFTGTVRTYMVDVGKGHENADLRVKDVLQDVRSPLISRVFLSATHDNGYANTLNDLIMHGLRSKLVLLPGYTEIAGEIQALKLPVLRIPDLFEPEKLLPVDRRFSTTSMISQVSSRDISRSPSMIGRARPAVFVGFTSASVPADAVSEAPSSPGAKEDYLPFELPASPPVPESSLTAEDSLKQFRPPPCYNYYLLQHCKGSCGRGHSYNLSPAQIEALRQQAKKKMCKFIRQDKPCRHGDTCLYGHSCPNGPECQGWKHGKGWCPNGKAMAHAADVT